MAVFSLWRARPEEAAALPQQVIVAAAHWTQGQYTPHQAQQLVYRCNDQTSIATCTTVTEKRPFYVGVLDFF